MNILIKFASRGRPIWLMRGISNIYNTISHPEKMKIMVTLDNDDQTVVSKSLFEFMDSCKGLTYRFGQKVSKIEAINRDMDKSGDDWQILVNMSDDMFFIRQGWDNVIRQRMSEHFPDGDCFLHFNDGYVKDALATMSIMDRKYYNRDGYIYHPSYKSFSCDAEAYFVAVARGRHKYFDEILAKHQHPTNMPAKNDETYSTNSLATEEDTKNYWARLHRDFDVREEGLTGPFPWDKYKRQ